MSALDRLTAERNDLTWWHTPAPPLTVDPQAHEHRAELLQALVGFESPRDRRPKPTREQQRASRIEDIRWLLDPAGGHDSPRNIAARHNTTPQALMRWLLRHDQPELARRFARPDSRAA